MRLQMCFLLVKFIRVYLLKKKFGKRGGMGRKMFLVYFFSPNLGCKSCGSTSSSAREV